MAGQHRDEETESLAVQVKLAHVESRRTYGAPQIRTEAGEQGVRTSQKRVARLMCEQHLRARRNAKFVHTTDSKHGEPIAPQPAEPAVPGRGAEQGLAPRSQSGLDTESKLRPDSSKPQSNKSIIVSLQFHRGSGDTYAPNASTP